MDNIVVRNITKEYRKHRIRALDNVCLEIYPGEILVLLGPNGAGKTSLIKILSGTLSPDSGEIIYKNKNICDERHEIQKEIGIVFESAQNMYGYLTVEENLLYFGYLNMLPKRYLKSKIIHYLEIFDLLQKKTTSVNHLSRGMKQKVATIMAMIKNPSFLFLDEPTLGLDILSSKKIKSIIKNSVSEKNMGVLLTTHDMHFAKEMGDRFIFINHGQMIWEGSTENLRKLDFFRKSYIVHFYNVKHQTVNDGIYEIEQGYDENLNLVCSDTEINDAIDYLRSKDAKILSVESQETDLSEIFERLVK